MEKELLQQAQKALAIQDVYFERATAEILGDFDPAAEDQPLSVQFRSRVIDTRRIELDSAEGHDHLVRIVADCAMRLIAPPADEPDQGADEKALVTARLVAEYLVVDVLSDAALREFAEHNGTFHAWPFWREYVHTACARLRIPVVPVPMYTLPRRPRPSAPKTSGSAQPPNADIDGSGAVGPGSPQPGPESEPSEC
jgi:hypothetical protein